MGYKYLLVISLFAFLLSCGTGRVDEKNHMPQQKPEKAGKAVITIGVVAPITGQTATFGKSTREGVILAFEQIENKITLDGKEYKINVVFADDQGSPEAAVSAYNKLITHDKVLAIIGTVQSNCSLAGAPLAQKHKVPMISTASTNPKVTQTGDFIFRACFIDPFQGKVMAKYAIENLKLKTAAVIFDNANDYSKGLAEVFKKTYEELGGKVVSYQPFPGEDKTKDFSPLLTQIKSAKPELIFAPCYYQAAAQIAIQAKKLGLAVPILGGDGFDSPKLVEVGQKDVEGLTFSNHYSKDTPSTQVKQFVADYEKKFNSTPDALAVLSYDASKILIDALKRAGKPDSEAIKKALTETKDLEVVSGKITFDAERNPIKSAAILQIKNGKQVYITTVNP
ncbi:MAG: ABC transporter substrate-binding protein [Candidatus Coatesbacteria bacterium]|nr:ABC transporter substrate-binding protein [Candidatus Coatesbacteria bacterium]